MFTPNSSAFNRFIAAQLFHVGAFQPLIMHGRTQKVAPLSSGGFQMTFSTGFSDRFNVVVQRHGPLSGLRMDFPELANACEPLQESWKSADSDWTNRILIADEDFTKSSCVNIAAAADPLHREDVKSVLELGWKISSVANRETVMVVVGTGLWQELLDRPAAQIIQTAVNGVGKTRFRRASILSDRASDITPEVHTNPVISVGGPNVNRLSDLLKDENFYEMETGVFGSWGLHLDLPRVALWGTDPRGTLRAVEEYTRNPEGLQAFLRQSWK
jgi:hypothetical protein